MDGKTDLIGCISSVERNAEKLLGELLPLLREELVNKESHLYQRVVAVAENVLFSVRGAENHRAGRCR
jgi:hypothetical protein